MNEEGLPPVGAILVGPQWPARVRVVRAERRSSGRVLIEAVTLDEGSRLLTRWFQPAELAAIQIEAENNLATLAGNPLGFKLAAEAPARHVITVGVELTEPEQQLYEAVTDYVADYFNRAMAADNRNVTFALIVLQRRLASSVRAIRRSLEQRRDRLQSLADEVCGNPSLLEAARRGEPLDELSEDAPESERWEAEERSLRYTLARRRGCGGALAERVAQGAADR